MFRGRAKKPLTIVGYDLGAPPTWGLLPEDPVDGPDGAAARQAITAVANDLTTDAEAAARLEQALLQAQPGLLAHGPSLATAVWVPDPVAGVPLGHMVVELLVGDGTDIDRYAEALDPEPRPGQQVLRFDTDRARLPAGETLVISTAGSESGGDVEEVLRFVVFPDGTADGMALTFATTALHLADDLAADAWAIAETLTVELGEAAE